MLKTKFVWKSYEFRKSFNKLILYKIEGKNKLRISFWNLKESYSTRRDESRDIKNIKNGDRMQEIWFLKIQRFTYVCCHMPSLDSICASSARPQRGMLWITTWHAPKQPINTLESLIIYPQLQLLWRISHIWDRLFLVFGVL